MTIYARKQKLTVSPLSPQAEAEKAMKEAGVKGPKRCACENPHGYRDEDEIWRCHKCGGVR